MKRLLNILLVVWLTGLAGCTMLAVEGVDEGCKEIGRPKSPEQEARESQARRDIEHGAWTVHEDIGKVKAEEKKVFSEVIHGGKTQD